MFPISELKQIIYSKFSKELIFVFPRIFDLHYICDNRDEILEYIFMARDVHCKLDNNLEFFFEDNRDLHDFCNHKNKAKTKLPKEEGMIVNKYEFNVHFLGKEEKMKNLVPKSGNINLRDFKFLKMLGIGGFSKVYLVLHRRTKELFAMKSVRLPREKRGKERGKHKSQIQNERDILVRIKHPFIVKLKYAFKVKHRFFFVMAFIQ
jgi:hypothetical protein